MSKANKDTPIIPPSKNAKGFSTALLLGLSPVQSSLFEMSEGVVENPRLNTSASAVQGDTSSMMNDFLTADLMQKIEQLSPISSNQQIKTRMSDVLMINCDDNNSSSGSSDDNSNLYSKTHIRYNKNYFNNIYRYSSSHYICLRYDIRYSRMDRREV